MADTQNKRDSRMRDAAKPYLGKPGPTRFSRAEITRAAIWNFCEVAQDGNPAYWDEEFARKSRYGRLIAPCQSLMTLVVDPWWVPSYVRERAQKALEAQGQEPSEKIGEMLKQFGYTVNTNVTNEFEYLAPFGPGDGRIKSVAMTVDISEEKQTRVGKGVFITSVTESRTEKDDRLIARSKNVLLKYKESDRG